jgi:SAM-dependent methyltransferase
MMLDHLRTRLKWAIFPGINLHARLRYERLPAQFGAATAGVPRRVLDAGCGNGMLAYRSFLLGNEVIGVTFKDSEVAGCRRLFNSYLGIPEARLRFERGNLYDLAFDPESFDEIICAEVLEHLRDDAAVCRTFRRIMKADGVLHVCAPNAEHPYNASFPLDKHESGGHVRPGYTLHTYRNLLESIGFRIERSFGLGGPIRHAFNWRIKETQAKYGAWAGIPLFAASIPSLWIESERGEREMPFSIYVRARKV